MPLALAGPLGAQEAVIPAPPRITIRLPDDTIALRRLPALEPGGRLGLWTPATLVADRWAELVRAALDRGRADRWKRRILEGPGPAVAEAPDTVATPVEPPVVPPPPEEAAEPADNVFEALGRYADLGLDLNAHLEMNLDKLKNNRCTAVDVSNPASGCQGGFPTPSFDQQFRVRSGGVISDRIHVNVDFDSEREFNANNNINVWYQGLEDEIVRRVEIGNVTFRAPPSRFISAAIPANSFGIQAEAQVGPLELRSIFAQQRGSSLRSRTFTVGETTSQPVDFESRDLDFVSGRFFFVVDPRELPGYPAVDVLNVDRSALPEALRLAEVRVYRLRAQDSRGEGNTNLGGIDAVAVRDDSPQRVGPFPWELLVEGRDYYLDPSGTWFAMAARLDTEDFLAVSYVTVAGDTVGTFPALDGDGDTLELIHEPRRGPDAPTFFSEMRNVYRVGGSDVLRSSLEMAILVNESEQPLDGSGTYLSLLGLAVSNDPFTLDEFNRVFPRTRDPNQGEPVRDYFVVFPHLQPFADSARLQAGERNDSLYVTPTYLLFSQGPAPRFTAAFHYDASGAGDRSALSLGAIQVREGSERLLVGGQPLQRGVDYQIDYQLGVVTFLNPDSLFFGPTQVEARFEENQLFDVAPKTLLGVAATYTLGPFGRVHAIGVMQRERTVFTRPQLGFEPQSHFMGGLAAELEFRPNAVTNLFDALPLIETDVPSRLDIDAEIAMSQPNPNQQGVAFIEEFERESGTPITLLEREFQLGSAPSSGRGLPTTHLDPSGAFSPFDAVPLTWQNAIIDPNGAVLEFEPREIDSTIVLAGAGFTIEPVLWLTMKPDTVGGAPHPLTGEPRWFLPHTPGPRWRSITQPLGGGSGVGADLSRVEFLEFWVLENADRTAQNLGATLVFDFGAVFEDATDFAPESFREVAPGDTTFSGFRLVGEGVLDTEKDPLTNVFNAVVDDIGIRGDLLESILDEGTGQPVPDFAMCDVSDAVGLAVFPLGDLATICTRRNGRLDTEDINGDNRLDVNVGAVEEHVFRYVFPIGGEEFFVREGVTHLDGNGRPLTWRLYRIPFREDSLQVGLPNIRQIQALRLTMVAPDRGPEEQQFFVALARLRLVGAPWIKRAATPIVGITGSRGEPRGEVIASIVSTENQDLGYEPPPGTFDEADRRGTEFEVGPRQVNERSLRLLAEDLRAGERAEALRRFTDEADRNFLKYRQLRVWARGRGPGWEENDLEFFIKVGRDENNFYMYRTPAKTTDWLPEVVIDLERWLDLRAQVEVRFLRGDAPSGSAACGGDPEAFVACDGPYLVHMLDPAVSPPNLARVSEVAVGMLRVGETIVIPEAELWVDDIRLSQVVDDVGIAAAFDARLAAADVAELALSFSRRDDRFREIGEEPTYVADQAMQFRTLFRADKLLPQSLGLSVPVTFQHVRTSNEPFYINRTDVRADALPGLRDPRGRATSLDVSLRRVQRGQGLLTRALADPVSLRFRYQTASDVTSLSSAKTINRQVNAEYNNLAGARTTAGAPGFLKWLVDKLPGFIRNSAFGEGIRTSRLRWNPAQIRVATTFTNNVSDRFAFRVPVALAGDDALQPLRSTVHTWRNELGIDIRPYSTLSLRLTYASTRDLQDYGDSTTIGRLLDGERRALLGTDVGFERLRTLSTALNVAPVLSRWLRPRLVFTSNFAFNRDPNASDPVREGADSSGAFRVPETLANSRAREMGTTMDVAELVRGVAGDSGFVPRLFRGLLPADVAHRLERRSSFDRAPFSPDLASHLALGGLDDFRFHDGIPATAAADITTLTASGGTRLPLGTQLRLNYRDQNTTMWSRRGADQTRVIQRTEEWPSLSASWVYSPSWLGVLSTISAQTQYRVVESSSRQPVLGAEADTPRDVITENNSRTVSPSVTLAWTRGITTTGQYSTTSGESVTSGNVTESDREAWGGSLSFAFRPPRSVVRLPNAIQTTVAFNASKLAVCLRSPGADECTPVSDSRRRQFDVRLDTGLSQSLRGGATFSYVVTDQRHLSNQLTQIVFTIFADINLFAGQLR